ncbi:MAG TPA: LLM class flavin-dependent oxidoreductase [Candidatus Limnocylindria bacterium]|nr:LLM class flavin-dependent oxidoreductase [Candidatus Limnocylindria bacterium]
MSERGISIGFKTSPQDVDWSTLDAMWAQAGDLDVFESAWLNDHLTNMNPDPPGPSLEALTLLGTLVHRVPGKFVGHSVLSNTFRHPAVLAKAATVLDLATGGRFMLGLGAGWYEGEHGPFGIEMPPIGERIDRLISAVDTIRALFSDAAYRPTGVTRPDPFYPLAGATNLPPPIRQGGPLIILGGQKPRGIALAARAADGWVLPGVNAGDVSYFRAKRGELLAAMERVDREPTGFRFIGQINITQDPDWTAALQTAREFVTAGATDMVLAVRAADGPDGLVMAARRLAEPLREAVG